MLVEWSTLSPYTIIRYSLSHDYYIRYEREMGTILTKLFLARGNHRYDLLVL
jgi:hypothetical protein